MQMLLLLLLLLLVVMVFLCCCCCYWVPSTDNWFIIIISTAYVVTHLARYLKSFLQVRMNAFSRRCGHGSIKYNSHFTWCHNSKSIPSSGRRSVYRAFLHCSKVKIVQSNLNLDENIVCLCWLLLLLLSFVLLFFFISEAEMHHNLAICHVNFTNLKHQKCTYKLSSLVRHKGNGKRNVCFQDSIRHE